MMAEALLCHISNTRSPLQYLMVCGVGWRGWEWGGGGGGSTHLHTHTHIDRTNVFQWPIHCWRNLLQQKRFTTTKTDSTFPQWLRQLHYQQEIIWNAHLLAPSGTCTHTHVHTVHTHAHMPVHTHFTTFFLWWVWKKFTKCNKNQWQLALSVPQWSVCVGSERGVTWCILFCGITLAP